ncbi:MAG: FAD-binding protein [Aigarchaeota archaeon]|nr:FAD-binding protein [Aigarchaeota archaeon]MCX8192465.1 FAD-binding protein [Nitrososphaeria archaeon]MDW7986712.1 FAD-linked oxidase C-terminal domain-containing protein [Nitrososphaerota archaeon]
MNKNDVVRDLRKIVGSGNIEDDELILKLYTRSASNIDGSAIAVVFPRSSEEVSNIVRYCYKNDIKIYPQGSASELVGSSTPYSDGIVLSFEKMNKVKEVSILDSYVITEPGIRLFELNQLLAKYGYMFPVDPASVKSASVGGAINNDSGGMMGARYGTVKNWVLELELVIPDEHGTILRVGSKTMKYRGGYDLVRLIVGSEGTLAITTSATLRITPIPENIVTIGGFFQDMRDLMETVIDVKTKGIELFVMEFIDDKTVESACRTMNLKIKGEGHYLLTSIAVAREASERVLSTLESLYRSHNVVQLYKARSQEEAEKMGLLDIRRALYPLAMKIAHESRRDPRSKMFVEMEDISVPPSKLIEAVNRLRSLEASFGIPMVIGGHVGDGNIHPIVWVEETDRDKLKTFYEMIKEIRRIGTELGGTFSSEHGVGIKKKERLVEEFEFKKSLKSLEVMKEVKKIFDPKGILNPGKMF